MTRISCKTIKEGGSENNISFTQEESKSERYLKFKR